MSKLRVQRPVFTASTAEFVSVIDGSFFAGPKAPVMLAYGQVKYLGALHSSAGDAAVACGGDDLGPNAAAEVHRPVRPGLGSLLVPTGRPRATDHRLS